MHREPVLRICDFARRFRSERRLTPLQIFEESGYASCRPAIAQEEIEAVVAEDPTLIDAWVSYSEDKRWTPAWALGRRDDGAWSVCHVLDGGAAGYEVVFGSPTSACAFMIRMEMEDLRLAAARRPIAGGGPSP